MAKMRYLLSAARRSSSDLRRAVAFAARPHLSRLLHSQPSPPSRPNFGIAFDIDGVILLGNKPIGGAPQALRRLYDDEGRLRIPFLFLTNGGGVPESRRASELSRLLGVHLSPLQVLLGHSLFRDLVGRFEHEFTVAVGKGEPAAVMSDYGFKKVLSIDEYSSYFEGIDPLAQYKTWAVKQPLHESNDDSRNFPIGFDVRTNPVRGVFVVSDPVDWGRDIQVLCDILRTGGLPGNGKGHQPPLYFANDDLEYQSTFPSERLGMGAFRLALECVFNRIHSNMLEYTSFGKPNPSVFKAAEGVLRELASTTALEDKIEGGEHEKPPLSRLYMIGDNPSVDIYGAGKAGHPWFSILTRTGVFKGKENHPQIPADLVVDTVEEAVDYVLSQENVL